MSRNPSKAAVQDEALRSIGRNVLIFQKIETALKALIEISDVKITSSGVDGLKSSKSKPKPKPKPLGQVVDEFHKSIYSRTEESNEADDPEELSVRMQFRVESEPETKKTNRQELRNLVAARNRLIHKRLVNFDHNNEDECKALIEELDAQKAMLLTHWDRLSRLLNAYRDMRAYVSSVLETGELDELLGLDNESGA